MEKIEAEHIYIGDLFESKYLFKIPDFQRPFSWEEENFEQLVYDIRDAMDTNKEKNRDLSDFEPYFLGSIIQLQSEKDSSIYSIIDGQQRIISLTILMAVMRDLVEDEDYKFDLQSCIYQKARKGKGKKGSVRIMLRDKEKDLFMKYILEEGGTKKITNIDKNKFRKLNEPQQRIITAIKVFRNSFLNGNIPDQELLGEYTEYLLQKVVMVVITAKSLDSAFRLFNVVNARGMPLTNADLLKSVNLGRIDEEEVRNKYTKIWEDIEEDIGIENLEMLISFIRSIKLKNRARKTIFDEFQQKIFVEEPDFNGKNFIKYLKEVKIIYQEKIIEGSITISDVKDVYFFNLMAIMRDFLPFNDWMAALIKFHEKFDDDNYLYDFTVNLERKIFMDWVIGLSIAERLTGIYRIIRLTEEKDDPLEIINDPMFHKEIKSERKRFKEAIDHENFYTKGRYRIAKYVLLRINMERRENLHSKISFSGNITVEHILPKNPNKMWKSKFTEKARQEWTNKLGNLTLLNGNKNSRASNKMFGDKVKTYFKKKSDFGITNELEGLSDWNLLILKDRHSQLRREAREIWIEST